MPEGTIAYVPGWLRVIRVNTENVPEEFIGPEALNEHGATVIREWKTGNAHLLDDQPVDSELIKFLLLGITDDTPWASSYAHYHLQALIPGSNPAVWRTVQEVSLERRQQQTHAECRLDEMDDDYWP